MLFITSLKASYCRSYSFFFFSCYQSVLGKKHFQCLILIKLFLHFNFLHTKRCSPADLSFNQRLIFSSSPSYLTQLTLHWRCRKAANVIEGRAGMKFITCNLLLSNRAQHTRDSLVQQWGKMPLVNLSKKNMSKMFSVGYADIATLKYFIRICLHCFTIYNP